MPTGAIAYIRPMSLSFDMHGRRVPIAETIGMELVERSEGRAVLRWRVQEEYTNPIGQLQGGMFAVLMDSAMAVAAGGLATATMQFSLLRPALPGTLLVVTGEVVKAGNRITYAEAEVRDEAGVLIARANQSGLPRPPEG